jgi:hypothetical protein
MVASECCRCTGWLAFVFLDETCIGFATMPGIA